MASELSMNGRKKIETIQKEFTQKFPYLTLVFLDQQRTALDISKSLSEVRQAKGADISIIASLKVNTLEKRFNESFGLIVEVAYKKDGKVVYTKDNVDKTLNELNKWCESNQCEAFEFKKGLTGNTIKSVQEQLFAAIKDVFSDADAKKINKDNFLDIHIPSVSPARGTHLFFNTSKNDIKVGYYTRDKSFIKLVTDNNFVEIEAASNGLRIKGNPTFSSVEKAISAALNFLGGILNDKSFVPKGEVKIEYKTETEDEYNKIKSQEKKINNSKNSEIDEFNKAIQNFKNQNIDEVAKYVESGNPVLQFSNDNGVIDNYLISMVSGGNLDQRRLDLYLSKGLDINATTSDSDAYTACHFATWDGNDEVLSLLIDAGANPDVVGGDTMTPLNLATTNGHVECVNVLIENNVNLENRVVQGNIYHSDKGGTALRDAVLNQLWDVADILIEAGASIGVLNEKCSNGNDFFEVITQFAKDSDDPKLHLRKIEDLKKLMHNSQSKTQSAVIGIDDETIKAFVENFGNEDLSGFLENYLESDKIVVLSISRADLESATNQNEDYSDKVEVLGHVEMNEWKDLAKLIGKKEAEWAKKEFSEENSSGIVLLYCEGKYVYAFSNPESNNEENEDEVDPDTIFDLEDLVSQFSSDFEEFDLTDESEIDFICQKIEEGKVLTNLLYVNEALSEKGFEVDNHQAYFFDSSVLISDRELSGFLLVNMDGFYSNCMNEDELTALISWNGVTDLRYNESDDDCTIDIVTSQGELTIKKEGSHSLKVLYTFYKSVWEAINDKYSDEPFINWNEVCDMGITEIGFNFAEEYKNFELGEIVEDDETEEEVPAKKAVPNILPKNAVELVKCVSILSFYYLSMNNNKDIYDTFQSGMKKLFRKENFGNSDSEIVKEIKTHIANNTIDQIIEEGESMGNDAYDKKYDTHNDFLGDISRYIRHLDNVDDAKFQLAYLKLFIELGNSLNSTTDDGNIIKIQDRYLIVQIALSNWYNISEFETQIDELLKKVKYNFEYGNLYKYSMLSDSLSLIEKAALFVYNIILLNEDGLEIKNKDIIRAKQLIAEVFDYEIKIEGGEIIGSYNHSGEDDLGLLIGGFDGNFCLNVMHFYNCHFSIDDFRDRCKELFVESYQEINDFWGGYIEDRIEEIEFDAEDEREEKILDQYNEARHEAEDEE